MGRLPTLAGKVICSLATLLPFRADAQTLRILNTKDGSPMAGVRDSVILSDGRWAAKTSGADGISQITVQDWTTGIKQVQSKVPLNVKIYPRNTLVSGSLGVIMELPKRGEVSLAGYTITGQKLFSFSGIYDAGIWEFNKETSHWAKQPIFIRAVFDNYAVSTKAIIMNSGVMNGAAGSDNTVSRIGGTGTVTQDKSLAKTDGLTATICAAGDHLYLPWDSTMVSLTGDTTQATINGKSGVYVTFKLYDLINPGENIIPNATLNADNKNKVTNSIGEAKITLLPQMFIPVTKNQSEFYPQITYTETGSKDTTIPMGMVRKTPATGRINVDDRSFKYIDSIGYFYRESRGCETWNPVYEGSDKVFNIYFLTYDSTGYRKYDTNDVVQRQFRDTTISCAIRKNDVSKSMLNPVGYFNKIRVFYPDTLTIPIIYSTRGCNAVLDYTLPATFYSNVGPIEDLARRLVNGFEINMNAKRPPSDFVGMDKELYFNFFNELAYVDGIKFYGINNPTLVFYPLDWNTVKYFQQPCDQALQRIAATEYIGRYIQNGQFIFGTMGTISKPRY